MRHMDTGSSLASFFYNDPRPIILWSFCLMFVVGGAWLLLRWTRRHWRPSAGDRILFLAAAAFILDALARFMLDRFGITVAYIGGPLFDHGQYPESGWLLRIILSVRAWRLAPAAFFAVLYLLLSRNARKGPDAAELGLPPDTTRQSWLQRLTGFLSSLILVYAILAIFSIALNNRVAALMSG